MAQAWAQALPRSDLAKGLSALGPASPSVKMRRMCFRERLWGRGWGGPVAIGTHVPGMYLHCSLLPVGPDDGAALLRGATAQSLSPLPVVNTRSQKCPPIPNHISDEGQGK